MKTYFLDFEAEKICADCDGDGFVDVINCNKVASECCGGCTVTEKCEECEGSGLLELEPIRSVEKGCWEDYLLFDEMPNGFNYQPNGEISKCVYKISNGKSPLDNRYKTALLIDMQRAKRLDLSIEKVIEILELKSTPGR